MWLVGGNGGGCGTCSNRSSIIVIYILLCLFCANAHDIRDWLMDDYMYCMGIMTSLRLYGVGSGQ